MTSKTTNNNAASGEGGFIYIDPTGDPNLYGDLDSRVQLVGTNTECLKNVSEDLAQVLFANTSFRVAFGNSESAAKDPEVKS